MNKVLLEKEKAKAKIRSGILSWQQGNYTVARVESEIGLHALEAIVSDLSEEQQRDANENITTAIINLGNIARDSDDVGLASAHFERALQRCIEMEDTMGAAVCHTDIGLVKEMSPETWDEAEQHFQKALVYWRDHDNPIREAGGLLNLGMIESNRRNFENAQRLFIQARAIYEKYGDTPNVGRTYHNEGLLKSKAGNSEEALRLLRKGLQAFVSCGFKRDIQFGLIEIGSLLIGIDPDRATTLMGAAQRLREEIPIEDATLDQNGSDPDIQKLHVLLPTQQFEDAWEQGRRMTVELATNLAISIS